MTGEKNIDEKVKELLARPIESMSDARAIVHVGQIVDLGADLHSSDITEKAIQLLDALGTRSLCEVHQVLRLYFLSNAYATRVALAGEGSVWVWEQADRQKQIIELRRAVRHPGFEGVGPQRQCQILTNLANQLNTVGRFVEAIELWDRALALNPNFAMALGNRGAAFLHYARAL
jgi:tetratricopeptide (TPR) repeat protein